MQIYELLYRAKMRADTLAIMEEIEKKRKELTDLQQAILQNLEETSNRNNESNVQKVLGIKGICTNCASCGPCQGS